MMSSSTTSPDEAMLKALHGAIGLVVLITLKCYYSSVKKVYVKQFRSGRYRFCSSSNASGAPQRGLSPRTLRRMR
jgi:hypothetical protein